MFSDATGRNGPQLLCSYLAKSDAVCLVFISVLPPPCATASCPRGATEEAASWLRAQLKDGWTSRDFNYGRNPAPVWAARCKPVTSPSRGISFLLVVTAKRQPFLYALRIIFDFPRRLAPTCASWFSFFHKDARVKIQSGSVFFLLCQ